MLRSLKNCCSPFCISTKKTSPLSFLQYTSNTARRSYSQCTEVFRIQIIDINTTSRPCNRAFRKLMSKSLFISVPKKLLKCKIRVKIDIPVYYTFRSHGYSHLIMSYPTKILNYSHKSIIPSYISATRYRLP